MKLILTAALLAIAISAFGENDNTIFFKEDFEGNWNSSSSPTAWTQSGSQKWKAETGGGTPANSPERYPSYAHGGNYNALFYKISMENKYQTYLISPKINLSNAQKPLLTFWYAQLSDQMEDVENNFKFTLYYRVVGDAKWSEIRNYDKPTNILTPWVCDSIQLPDSICKKENIHIQIAFLGTTNTIGHGCCIDDIKIEETQTAKKYVGNGIIYAANTTANIIPTSSNDNAILRLRIPVLGNDSTLYLNSIKAKALQKAKESTKENGVKLYYTSDETFNTKTLLGITSIDNDGYAFFNNIRLNNEKFDLNTGSNYLWIACDIKDDTDHDLRNNIIDFKIEPQSIDIDGIKYPAPGSELNPAGYRMVSESIFFDDFENASKTDDIWTFIPEFERSEALGKGGKGGNADPAIAHGGSFIIGTDIKGTGSAPGDYESGIVDADKYYAATTKEFDCYYYRDISLLYYRWLNVAGMDIASIGISTDGGNTWKNTWSSSAIILDKEWTFQSANLSRYADRNTNVKIRFTLGPTLSGLNYSGWNLDDIALVGTFIYHDAAITEILTPKTDCGYTTEEPVTITILNAGYNDIDKPFTVSYSLDGKDWVSETVTTLIPRKGSIEYTFEQKADLSKLGEHNIKVNVKMDEDEDSRNNSIETNFLSLPYYDLPYTENFDMNNNGYWTCYGKNKTWQYGTPDGKIISSAYSGSRCWATTDNYLTNDTAWLESPCFNMQNIQKPIIEFMLKGNSATTDGLSMYYSTDNGNSWLLIPFEKNYDKMNWYNTSANIEALGTAGWSGNFNWTKIQQLLPDGVAYNSSVKFRFVFASKGAESEDNSADTSGYDGFAIDNIKLYESPADAGVVAFMEPTDQCYLSEEQSITVSIKNYGIRDITSNDSIITSVKINNTLTLTDTFFVAENITRNSTANFTFKQKVNMRNKKTYDMVATTQIKGDTLLFSNTNNDSFHGSATVLGEPTYTLGPDRGTTTPQYLVLDGGTQTNKANFDAYEWKDNFGNVVSNKRASGSLNPFPDNVQKYSYTIKVTTVINESLSCYAYDTINIINSNTDIGITNVTGLPATICNSQENNVSVTVKNMSGSYSVDAGEKISICYTMLDADNNLFTVAEDTVLEGKMLPSVGDTESVFEYKFKKQPVFKYDGEQQISFFTLTVSTADINHSNDTISKDITVWPLPTVDLGADSILTNDPTQITLRTDYIEGAKYKWLNGPESDNCEYVVTSPQTQEYTVAVTDIHNCATAVGTVKIISNDWKIEELVSPIDICLPESGNDITVRISNLGSDTFTAGYKIPATITIDGVTTNEMITLPANISANNSFNYTFNRKMDMPDIKKYSINININPEHDLDRTNNFIYEDISVWGTEKVSLGADTIFTLMADTIILDAGPNYTSYKWNGSEYDNNQTYQVSRLSGRTYSVVVTNEHGCYDISQQYGDGAKASVTVVATDLEINEINSPNNDCEIAELNLIILTVKNSGNDAISTNTVVPLKVKINDLPTESISYEFTSPLKVGESTIMRIPYNQFNFKPDETYNFKIWIDWNLDKFHSNDTMSTIIKQLPHPSQFSLGDDIYTTHPETITLSAPSGMANYAWFNGETGQTLQLSSNLSTRKISVVVNNEYGCQMSDTIGLFTYDLGFKITQGADNNCNTEANIEVLGQIFVKSNDIIPAGTNFTASYNVNGYSGQKSVTSIKEIEKDKPFEFTFDDYISFTDTGNYIIKTDMSVDNNIIEADPDNYNETVFRIGAYPILFEDTVRTYTSPYVIDPGILFKPECSVWVFNGHQYKEPRYTVELGGTGLYKLTTRDINNCKSEDETYIFFVQPKYEITDLGFKSSQCAQNTLTTISFYLKNTGNDVIAKGSQINISYDLDNVKTEESFTIGKTLYPDDSVLIAFQKQADLRDVKSYSLILTANVANNSCFNIFTLNTLEVPSVTLGEDITTVEQNVNLSPGANYNSFLWNTDETTSSINITKDGDYWVKVTNAYGCYSYDTINVHLIPATVAITKFNKPASSCGNIANEKISIELYNNGQKAITSQQKIGVKYTIDGVTRNEYFNPQIDFAIGAKLEHEMSDQLNLNGVGTHTITFNIDIDGIAQDSSTFNIDIYDIPEFKFDNDNIKVDQYPYPISVTPMPDVTYKWDTGEESNTINATKDGTYTLTVTSINNCQTTHSITVQKNAEHGSVKQTALNDIDIYPNPAKDVLNINFHGQQTAGCQVLVANASGQIIFASRQTSDIMQLDVADWNDGVYFIKITDDKAFKILKFVKE